MAQHTPKIGIHHFIECVKFARRWKLSLPQPQVPIFVQRDEPTNSFRTFTLSGLHDLTVWSDPSPLMGDRIVELGYQNVVKPKLHLKSTGAQERIHRIYPRGYGTSTTDRTGGAVTFAVAPSGHVTVTLSIRVSAPSPKWATGSIWQR